MDSYNEYEICVNLATKTHQSPQRHSLKVENDFFSILYFTEYFKTFEVDLQT